MDGGHDNNMNDRRDNTVTLPFIPSPETKVSTNPRQTNRSSLTTTNHHPPPIGGMDETIHDPTSDGNNNQGDGGRRRRRGGGSSSHQNLKKSMSLEVSNERGARAVVGLSNLGNTCFMNSCLQCVVHIRPLAEYFLDRSYERDLCRTSPMKGQLAKAFGDLILEMYSSSPQSSVTPSSVKKVVGKWAPQFSGYSQQDSQEFLRFLLDGLAEDLKIPHSNPNKKKKKSNRRKDLLNDALGKNNNNDDDETKIQEEEEEGSSNNPHHQREMNKPRKNSKLRMKFEELKLLSTTTTNNNNNGILQGGEEEEERKENSSRNKETSDDDDEISLPPSEKAQKHWDDYVRENDCIITHIFGGQLQNCCECQTCKHRSCTYDPFLDISLPIPKVIKKGKLILCCFLFCKIECSGDGREIFFQIHILLLLLNKIQIIWKNEDEWETR